jgi:hypothetical protein
MHQHGRRVAERAARPALGLEALEGGHRRGLVDLPRVVRHLAEHLLGGLRGSGRVCRRRAR